MAELEELTRLVMEELMEELEAFDTAAQADALEVMRRLEEEEEVRLACMEWGLGTNTYRCRQHLAGRLYPVRDSSMRRLPS